MKSTNLLRAAQASAQGAVNAGIGRPLQEELKPQTEQTMTTTNTNSQETLDIVKSIVEEMLQERFSPDDITFTEITVENKIDFIYGDEHIDIRIYYTGNHDVLDSKWRLSLPRLIADEMERRGLVVDKFPHKSFIKQEEWDEIKDWNYWDEID